MHVVYVLSCSSCWSVKITITITIRGVCSHAGAVEQGGGGDDPCPSKDDRWYIPTELDGKKNLAYSSEMAIATIYTHSKLAQLTAACNPDSNIGCLSNQRVRLSLNYH